MTTSASAERLLADGRLAAVKLGDNNASVRIDPVELADALKPVPQRTADLIRLEDVAARVGRSVEWALANVSRLPAVARADGYYVLAADLRAWHRAAREELETRSPS